VKYNIDEIRQVVNIKCTEKEKVKIEIEKIKGYEKYELNFIIQEETTNQ
jgi:hypothetical protein